MPHTYGDDDLENTEEKYHESSDDDFNPDAAPAEEASSSEDEDHVTIEPTQRKHKRTAPEDEHLDSGDEATIQAARRKRSKKKGKKGSKEDDAELIISDDEGGEGGLVKTRAQRRIEGKERRPLVRTEGATVDVDALWAQMTAAPLKPLDQQTTQQEADAPKHHTPVVEIPASVEEEEQLSIKKVFTFAGQDTTEEKQIPRSQLDNYLKHGWKPHDAPAATATATTTTSTAAESPKDPTEQHAGPKTRRPLRRPSRFDPNPTGYVRALAPEYQLSYPRHTSTTADALEADPAAEANPDSEAAAPPPPPTKKADKAHKLNVVDKSRMDWTGFVDKEGIAEELDTHGKTKEAYLGRMEFLAGVEARREEERRNAKMKSAAAASAPTAG
ncbi:BCNT-domain-containing protein [Stemphylium lycopersici]|uniref:SWR1-complex protein 5 n=1 Tax=Stemphylium lycopersici TaxID=183478 RepID=A0A364NBC1_STELY|nr:BCNT-domain-containing protein [Stemphylium lycopersici]